MCCSAMSSGGGLSASGRGCSARSPARYVHVLFVCKACRGTFILCSLALVVAEQDVSQPACQRKDSAASCPTFGCPGVAADIGWHLMGGRACVFA
ncbi:hypothetical protein K437DRAFT_82413 [Tilletiaria anomala UBC 951]|uniref:Uncharacterized protein n=1 Tax=Tilletiaria anomala (strain ATCC 24038 / CBS 436.72 / UBC 951) TaxID=1037660 RepID=A0A066V8K0_TILAU|nr:uncharacterized protein K437DRAFT_82413 [Tilletiaria anomala UBC 951]KDN35079.1 hypothetical protein K437DRAFT_82413 [Tilletiaria anomala UBC 951]